MSVHKLVFDATDSDTRAASSNVGAYLRASDGTLITHTGAALDVNIDNASIAVTASDLDIRDLSHVSDSVRIGDGSDFLAVNADGSINVNIAPMPLSSISVVAETVGTSAIQIVDGGDELANRKKLFMYNNGNRQMYIGPSGVTTSTGFPIPPGAILELDAGAAMDVYAIADAAAQNMRTLQLA